MTREEAIKILKAIRVYECYPKSASEETKEAIEMAIEALKENNQSDSLFRDDAENCKESESKLDLISRAEAVALVNRAIRGIGDKDVQECLFDGLRKQMWALPSAICDDCIWRVCNYNKIDWEMVDTMAEPKTGEWIPVSERLPEEYGEYLVTKRTIGWNCEEYGSNDIAYFDSDGFHKADKVTAWMPLPEPYKGDGEA